MTQVAGKVAFITGGGSGVGYGQASVFAAAGCKVAIADIRKDHLDEARKKLEAAGREVCAVKLDINIDDADVIAPVSALAENVHKLIEPIEQFRRRMRGREPDRVLLNEHAKGVDIANIALSQLCNEGAAPRNRDDESFVLQQAERLAQ